jgi:toxin ParE1/3/4
VASIVISPQADVELEEIWLSIAVDDPAAATRVVRELGAKIGLLAQYPRLGRRRSDIHPGMRGLVEGRYVILYETHPDTDDGPIREVEIVHIVHGHRDLRSLF